MQHEQEAILWHASYYSQNAVLTCKSSLLHFAHQVAAVSCERTVMMMMIGYTVYQPISAVYRRKPLWLPTRCFLVILRMVP